MSRFHFHTALWAATLVSAFSIGASLAAEQQPSRTQVGSTDGGGLVIPTSQSIRPAGQTLAFSGRPLDLVLSPDHSLAFVKNAAGITVIEAKAWTIRQTLDFKDEEGSMHGIAVRADPAGALKIYITGSHATLLEANMSPGKPLAWGRRIALPGPDKDNSHALGIALGKKELAYVCLSRNNSLAIVDLNAGAILTEIPVGTCPYCVVLNQDESVAYVTNFGGRRPTNGQKTANSAGTAVVVDDRGIPSSGTITKIDLKQRKVISEIEVGLHPTQAVISTDGRLFVANANSDTVSILDTKSDRVIETIDIRPDTQLPFGSVCNALALSRDEHTLFCANGGNNAVAVVSLGRGNDPNRVIGFIPTGWFPGALACDGQTLFIANVKGEGSREGKPDQHSWNSRYYRGSVTKVDAPDEKTLDGYTKQVRTDARLPQALAAMEKSQPGQAAVPVPAHLGAPSVFRHIVYVLKENRTYDQLFGDLPQGNAEPKLCTYGRQVTPNQHALAEQFALLDNYYCNGVVSADGHQWATQGMVTDYQEKDFGGWTRSYDFGTDALCYAACDFLWDTAILHGLTFRNYGEFDFPSLGKHSKNWFDVDREWKSTGKVEFKQSIGIDALKRYTAPDYPGWLLSIPDGYRIERFLREFAQFEKDGDWPNLVLVYLPQDHTSGTKATVPTPRAYVADNDLAVGKLVEAISHSQYWPSTCIFVNEDDPQNGYDHVDGHRSICLVASPYTKRGAVVSHFYNQTSVLHTICRMLGLPPMNQMVALAPTMEDCFDLKPDLTRYDRVPNNIALDERNKPKEAMLPTERRLAEAVEAMDFSRPDRINDDTFNRLLWSLAKPGQEYPATWAGAHGKGLKSLSLKLQKQDDDD